MVLCVSVHCLLLVACAGSFFEALVALVEDAPFMPLSELPSLSELLVAFPKIPLVAPVAFIADNASASIAQVTRVPGPWADGRAKQVWSLAHCPCAADNRPFWHTATAPETQAFSLLVQASFSFFD